MKNLKPVWFSAIVISLLISCGKNSVVEKKKEAVIDTSYKSMLNSGGINLIDDKGNRQGFWIITGAMQKNKNYADTARVEEGTYKDNLKEGEWEVFGTNGLVKERTFYSKGKPMSEEMNASTDDMKNNKKPIPLNYIDAEGKFQGFWIFTGAMKNNPNYADTARVETGTFVDNVKCGLWTEYNPDGSLKTQLVYSNRKPLK